MSTREWIAHAFTPWDWRSRASVIALVVLAGAAMIVGSVQALTDDIKPFAKALNLVIGEVIAYFLILRPAVRSLHRWDESHPARAAG